MRWFVQLSILSQAVTLAHTGARTPRPSNAYILAPCTRTLRPANVRSTNGTVNGTDALLQQSGNLEIHGGGAVVFDMGKNVAGLVSIDVAAVSDPTAILNVTFTESSLWISSVRSDASVGDYFDDPLSFAVGRAGADTYTPAAQHTRGAFRYLTLSTNATGNLSIRDVTVAFDAAPDRPPCQYAGSFVSNDHLLNRIWYAGAYTAQLATIPADRGNALISLGPLYGLGYSPPGVWFNNYTITNGTAALVDGGKRDRLVWPGDFVVSGPTVFASTNDLLPLKNSLDSLISLQDPTTGLLPYAGAPFNLLGNFLPGGDVSFTYNMHTLISMYEFYIFTGDQEWIRENWKAFQAGLEFCLRHIDESGLMNVTASADWLRVGMGAHNIEANAILYQTLTHATALARVLNDSSVTADITRYTTIQAKLKSAANTLLWDATAGLYRDNETTSLYPQDGNSWAVRANLTTSPAQNLQISQKLRDRWTKYGAPAPEVGGSPQTISPFATSFELQAHLLSGEVQTGLDLIRLQWGFMLDDPRMTNSTFIEGYSADGSLHYTPYAFDAKVSHAHGWSTGPTWALTFYVAGLQITGGSGETWILAPQPGDLKHVRASFETPKGRFSVEYRAVNGCITELEFETPCGTTGEVRLPSNSKDGQLVPTRRSNGRPVKVGVPGSIAVEGGAYRLQER